MYVTINFWFGYGGRSSFLSIEVNDEYILELNMLSTNNISMVIVMVILSIGYTVKTQASRMRTEESVSNKCSHTAILSTSNANMWHANILLRSIQAFDCTVKAGYCVSSQT